MKTRNIIIAIISFFVLTGVMTQKSHAQNVVVSFDVFYSNLSPFGRWIEHPTYKHIWIPNVASGFMPYQTGGHWIYTEFGWSWVSDYPWGWAAFHYGRWFLDPVYGWVWTPDYEWGPAWVVWTRSPGYYGWTPLAPGISISFALGGKWSVPKERWVFVGEKYIVSSHLEKHWVAPARYGEILSRSKLVTNSYEERKSHRTYSAGPLVSEVRTYTQKNIKTYKVKDLNTPGNVIANNTYQVYRPTLSNENSTMNKPQKVEKYNFNPSPRIENAKPKENNRYYRESNKAIRKEAHARNENERRSRRK